MRKYTNLQMYLFAKLLFLQMYRFANVPFCKYTVLQMLLIEVEFYRCLVSDFRTSTIHKLLSKFQ